MSTTTNSDTELEAITSVVTAVIRGMLPEILREVTTAVMSTSMRPAVIQSDSGVSSVTREKMASGPVKITAHIYHEDPYVADAICAQVYDKAIAWANDHAPGAVYTYTDAERQLYSAEAKSG